jgi:hypothetical protein
MCDREGDAAAAIIEINRDWGARLVVTYGRQGGNSDQGGTYWVGWDSGSTGKRGFCTPLVAREVERNCGDTQPASLFYLRGLGLWQEAGRAVHVRLVSEPV